MAGAGGPVAGVPRVLRPLVWLAALLWLPVRSGLRGGERFLPALTRVPHAGDQ